MPLNFEFKFSKLMNVDKISLMSHCHRHLSNIDCLTALFASLVLLLATAKKPWKTGARSRYITNLKQSILETFDIYGHSSQSFKTMQFIQEILDVSNLRKCKVNSHAYKYTNRLERIKH